MNADVVIVGAGPAGIFTALELLRRGSPEKIVMIEQGQAIENRRCPKAKTGRCMNCKPYCHITTGFSGAGAFSDGKLSLCSDVGGDLPTLVGEQKAQELIDYADSIYLEFGADEHVEGLENTEEIKQIRTRAIRAGLRLVDCPIRHLGTEKAHEVYLGIENYLRDHGVEMLFGCTCEDVILRDGRCCGVVAHDGHQDYTIEARHTVIATGGSMVLYPEAMAHLKEGSVVVWLQTPFDEIQKRMPKDLYDRGIAAPKGMPLREIYEERRGLYAKYADLIVASREGEDDTAQLVEEVMRTVGLQA